MSLFGERKPELFKQEGFIIQHFNKTEQFLSIERVGYLILGDDKEIKYYIVIKKTFVNVFPFKPREVAVR